MTNADPGFYAMLGPFLSRREIEKELGGPIYDDDDKTWFVALERNRVVGFCAARPLKSGGTHYESDYVAPGRRNARAVAAQLAAARAAAFPGRATITARAADVAALEAQGFTRGKGRGRFINMTRETQ